MDDPLAAAVVLLFSTLTRAWELGVGAGLGVLMSRGSLRAPRWVVETAGALGLALELRLTQPDLIIPAPPRRLGTSPVTIDPQGGRIAQAWAVFMSTDNFYWSGSSWTAGASDPPASASVAARSLMPG